MPEKPEVRIAVLEREVQGLTDDMKDLAIAVRELTAALNQMRGGVRWSLALGSALTLGMAGIWAVASWAIDHFARP